MKKIEIIANKEKCPICDEVLKDKSRTKEIILLNLEERKMGQLSEKAKLFKKFIETGKCPFCKPSKTPSS